VPLPDVRPFGAAPADLEADFAGLPRPHLVTEVLRACVGGLSARDAWAMTAGERVAALLQVLAAGGERALGVVLPCAACGARLEVELPAEALLSLHEQAAARGGTVTVRGASGETTLRRATGADQAEWLRAGFAEPEAAFRAMLDTLVVRADGDPPAEPDDWTGVDAAAVDRALGEADPLVAFEAAIACPECGREEDYPVDLQALVLERLRRAQARLMEQVHRLARAYHWSEAQAMALPAWRRARYLALVEREEGA
jgi:hypothetical protein